MAESQIELGGKAFTLTPPGKEDVEALDKFVMEHRQSPIDIVKQHLAGLDREVQSQLLREALQMEVNRPAKNVTPLEYAAVLETREGYAFMFWLMARKHHPELRQEDVLQLVLDATNEEFARLIERRDEEHADDLEAAVREAEESG